LPGYTTIANGHTAQRPLAAPTTNSSRAEAHFCAKSKKDEFLTFYFI
jgi:hypothetical protein